MQVVIPSIPSLRVSADVFRRVWWWSMTGRDLIIRWLRVVNCRHSTGQEGSWRQRPGRELEWNCWV